MWLHNDTSHLGVLGNTHTSMQAQLFKSGYFDDQASCCQLVCCVTSIFCICICICICCPRANVALSLEMCALFDLT
jgi:hypothetical protein